MIKELEIIGYFAQGQRHSIANQNLKLEYTETSIRLNDSRGKLIGISKQVNQWQRKVLISKTSAYKPNIINVLIDAGFIARHKSSHPDFVEYHYYQVPNGYKLNYTEVIQLWRIWWHNKRYQINVASLQTDILVFNKGNWHLVQDLQPKQGNFVLLTARGEITIEPTEYLVWIDSAETTLREPDQLEQQPKSRSQQSDSNLQLAPITATKTSMNQLELPIDSRPSANIIDLARTERNYHTLFERDYLDRLPEPEEHLDLESYLSTFNTEDAEDIDRIEGIYNISELLSGQNIGHPELLPATSLPLSAAVASAPAQIVSAAPAPAPSNPATTQSPRSIDQKQTSLKLKAMNVLATYLQEGDLIVHTEVLKNAQGQEINRKVTKIQRGCPSWAIEQIRNAELIS